MPYAINTKLNEEMKNNIHKADSLKAAFIDYILATFDKSVIIGHEVMYGSSGKFVDLVLLYKGETYAVEIKSNADSLVRIHDQIQEYQKQFNYVIVVCGEKYNHQLRERLPKSVGLFEVNDKNEVKIIRKGSRKLRLNKEEMLFSVKTSYLSKIADFPTVNLGPDAIRTKLTKKRTSCVQEILYNYWLLRLKPAFESFLLNRGSQTLPSDLTSFSSFHVKKAF